MTTPPATPVSASPDDNTTRADEEQRCCLACGYNLFGLGEEPRCPECGLLNIPSALRKQVWDLVDSGKWFFSRFLAPQQKRPPGWWWALDRPGDVRRSFKFAVAYLALTACLIFGTGAIADAVRLEVRDRQSYYRLHVPLDPTRSIVVDEEYTVVYGLGRSTRRSEYRVLQTRYGVDRTYRPYTSSSARTLFEPSWAFLSLCTVLFLWTFWIWAGPALVGLCTQIRKGLPDFAHAPRTILAAAVYESHRLPYLAAGIAVWMIVDTVARVTVLPAKPQLMPILWPGLAITFLLLGVGGWVGPLRSDYTRQLVQSRVHAARIVIMYAVVLPAVMVFIILAAYGLLFGF